MNHKNSFPDCSWLHDIVLLKWQINSIICIEYSSNMGKFSIIAASPWQRHIFESRHDPSWWAIRGESQRVFTKWNKVSSSVKLKSVSWFLRNRLGCIRSKVFWKYARVPKGIYIISCMASEVCEHVWFSIISIVNLS